MTEYDTVTGLNLFAVKSAQAVTVDGVRPERLSVGSTGFVAHGVRDRDFVIVEAEPQPDGQHLFVSQRGWDGNGKAVHRSDSTLAALAIDLQANWMVFSHPEAGEFALRTGYDMSGERYGVKVHSSRLACAIDQGAAAARYLSRLLDRNVRLARTNRAYPRMLPEQYGRPDASNQTAGADGMPFLLVSQTSLDTANAVDNLTGAQAVPLGAFRGNIETDGKIMGAYGEDFVRQFRIGQVVMHVVKACERCPVPTIDQRTGQLNAFPSLKILREHQGKISLGAKTTKMFGQNLNHVYQDGQYIAIGDPLTVLAAAGVRNFIEA